MKTIHEFITFTNLRQNRVKFTFTLIIACILYCLMLSFVTNIIYMGELFYYYLALYMFVIWTTYIFMVIVFTFLQKKRGTNEKLPLKSYILPLFGVQSIFYAWMLLLGVGAFMMNTSNSLLTMLASMLCMLLMVLYIPWQLLCFFQIYDGQKNPLKIIWMSLKKLVFHYRSCFYALFLLFLGAMAYQVVMSVFFDVRSVFSPFQAIQDLMIQSNPFVETINYFIFALSEPNLWVATIVSLVYGILMCVLLVYYIMVMLCIHDEDIKV